MNSPRPYFWGHATWRTAFSLRLVERVNNWAGMFHSSLSWHLSCYETGLRLRSLFKFDTLPSVTAGSVVNETQMDTGPRFSSGKRAGPGRAQHGPSNCFLWATFYFCTTRTCHITFLANACIIRRRNRGTRLSCFSRRDAPVTGVAGCSWEVVLGLFFQAENDSLSYTVY